MFLKMTQLPSLAVHELASIYDTAPSTYEDTLPQMQPPRGRGRHLRVQGGDGTLGFTGASCSTTRSSGGTTGTPYPMASKSLSTANLRSKRARAGHSTGATSRGIGAQTRCEVGEASESEVPNEPRY